MGKIIVKKEDSSIAIIYPNPNKYGKGKTPYSDCKALQKYKDHSWFVTDQQIDKSDLESRRQLYVEDGSTEIKKDLAWEKMLMPDQLIKQKHLKSLQRKFEKELEKENVDPVTCMRLSHQIDKESKEPAGNKNESEFWVQKAIEGLDRAELSKAEIKQKLEAKLNELRGKNG